jgi:hypothetical protein
MNKEQQELLDEAYKNYTKYPLATIHDHRTNILYQNRDKGWCVLNGRSMVSPHPTRHLTQQEFINKCKTDTEFSEKWGLKIEERELRLGERGDIFKRIYPNKSVDDFAPDGMEVQSLSHQLNTRYNNAKIPTKLITITYNDKTIESYEL